MYSLRSHTSQSTISFPQRKRRLEERLKAQGAPEAEEQEAGASPCKTRRGETAVPDTPPYTSDIVLTPSVELSFSAYS